MTILEVIKLRNSTKIKSKKLINIINKLRIARNIILRLPIFLSLYNKIRLFLMKSLSFPISLNSRAMLNIFALIINSLVVNVVIEILNLVIKSLSFVIKIMNF
jgi:hypothetical protein